MIAAHHLPWRLPSEHLLPYALDHRDTSARGRRQTRIHDLPTLSLDCDLRRSGMMCNVLGSSSRGISHHDEAVLCESGIQCIYVHESRWDARNFPPLPTPDPTLSFMLQTRSEHSVILQHLEGLPVLQGRGRGVGGTNQANADMKSHRLRSTLSIFPNPADKRSSSLGVAYRRRPISR